MTFVGFKQSLEHELQYFFDSEINSAPTAEFKLLMERMSALVLRGGKRARPELLLKTYRAYGGKNPESLIDICLALELHHQFLLMHDDIIDNDTIRYDGPNIMGYYQHDRFAKNLEIPKSMGLLAGDLAFTFAYQAIAKSTLYSAEQKVKLIQAINRANIQVCIGQQLDALNVSKSISDFTLEKLLQIHALKTAAYSTKLPMYCAAIVRSLDKTELLSVELFATQFGILFQLVDDHSDYFENESAFNNRPKFRDFRQGSVTYPLFVGYENADKNQRNFLTKYFGNKKTSEIEMKKVVEILKSCGGESASRKLIEKYLERSNAAIGKLGIDAKSKKEFRELLDRFSV